MNLAIPLFISWILVIWLTVALPGFIRHLKLDDVINLETQRTIRAVLIAYMFISIIVTVSFLIAVFGEQFFQYVM